MGGDLRRLGVGASLTRLWREWLMSLVDAEKPRGLIVTHQEKSSEP